MIIRMRRREKILYTKVDGHQASSPYTIETDSGAQYQSFSYSTWNNTTLLLFQGDWKLLYARKDAGCYGIYRDDGFLVANRPRLKPKREFYLQLYRTGGHAPIVFYQPCWSEKRYFLIFVQGRQVAQIIKYNHLRFPEYDICLTERHVQLAPLLLITLLTLGYMDESSDDDIEGAWCTDSPPTCMTAFPPSGCASSTIQCGSAVPSPAWKANAFTTPNGLFSRAAGSPPGWSPSAVLY